MASNDDLKGLLALLGEYHEEPKVQFHAPAIDPAPPTPPIVNKPEPEPEPEPEPDLTQAPVPTLAIAPDLTQLGLQGFASPSMLNELLGALPVEALAPEATFENVHIWTLCSAKGGVGKTTLAANLAQVLGQLGQSVVLIDLDAQNALRHSFEAKLKDTSYYQVADVNGALVGQELCQVNDKVAVVPFNGKVDTQLLPTELAQGALVKLLKQLALADGTIVIIDAATGPSVSLEQALAISELALAVTLPEYVCCFSLPLLERCVNHYTKTNARFKGMSYLLNNVQDNAEQSKVVKLLEAALKRRVLATINANPALALAVRQGTTFAELEPNSASVQQLTKSAQALLDTCRHTLEART